MLNPAPPVQVVDEYRAHTISHIPRLGVCSRHKLVYERMIDIKVVVNNFYLT